MEIVWRIVSVRDPRIRSVGHQLVIISTIPGILLAFKSLLFSIFYSDFRKSRIFYVGVVNTTSEIKCWNLCEIPLCSIGVS